MANEIKVRITADTAQFDKATADSTRKFKSAIDANTTSIKSMRSAVSGLQSALVSLGAATAFKNVAELGINLDKARNAMTALTGSVEKANAKMKELRELAKTSPGVTTTFATQLFNQLKATREVADQAINQVIKSLGKLNTVFGDIGTEFTQNLIQIFKTSFERDDIKQAINRVPIFEQLLKSAFGTDDPEKLRKLKAVGKLTLEGFLTGLSTAINTDPRFKNIKESLGGQLAKQFEETKLKLAELGEKILKTLIPALDKLLPLANKVLDAFKAMPDWLQASAVGFALLAPPIVIAANAIRTLAGSIITLAAAGTGSNLVGLLNLARFGLIAAPFAIAGGVTLLKTQEFNEQLAAREELAKRQPSPRFAPDIAGLAAQSKPGFLQVDPITGRIIRPTGAGAPSRSAFFGATGVAAAAAAAAAAGGGKTGGGGGSRFIQDFGLGETAKLEHEIELARIRQSIAATVARQQQPFNLQALPRLGATAPGIPDLGFPGGELAELARIAAEIPEKTIRIMSATERFMQGFADSVNTVGDAFERFGSNVARAFTNVRDLFGSLKRAVLDFFNDLIGSTLQNLVKSTLGGLFGGGGGGGIGGLFNNLFRSAGGRGLSAPPSISSIGSFFSGGGGSSAAGFGKLSLDPLTAKEFGLGGSFLGGIGKSFAAAAPLLGLGLGSSLGGQSVPGQIFGAAGGLLGGGAIAGFSGLLGKTATAFFTNPLTAIIGGGLLLGSFLFGRASQRKRDEEASGQMLLQAQQQIRDLAQAVGSNQIDASQARGIFEGQILPQFVSGINTLKTRSVRESRLTNQVRDLRKFFDDVVGPAITAQQQLRSNAVTHSKLIPEFATGGTAIGGLAFLHPGEKILNFRQQAAVINQSNPQVFERAGVPGARRGVNSFPHGGTFDGGGVPIELSITLIMGKQDQTRAVVTGINTPQGRAATVKTINVARTNRELG